MRGQLLADGSIGKLGTMSFPSALTIIEHLQETGRDATLTIGLSYRNPRTHDKPLTNEQAIRWVNENSRHYTFEACYTGDEVLRMTALSDNDLF